MKSIHAKQFLETHQKIQDMMREVNQQKRIRWEALKKLRTSLTPRDYGVLKMRVQGSTLEAIGKHFGSTRERIRQIEAKGMDRIRIISLEQ